jgi:hypothetical protein
LFAVTGVAVVFTVGVLGAQAGIGAAAAQALLAGFSRRAAVVVVTGPAIGYGHGLTSTTLRLAGVFLTFRVTGRRTDHHGRRIDLAFTARFVAKQGAVAGVAVFFTGAVAVLFAQAGVGAADTSAAAAAVTGSAGIAVVTGGQVGLGAGFTLAIGGVTSRRVLAGPAVAGARDDADRVDLTHIRKARLVTEVLAVARVAVVLAVGADLAGTHIFARALAVLVVVLNGAFVAVVTRRTVGDVGAGVGVSRACRVGFSDGCIGLGCIGAHRGVRGW